MRLWTLHPKYLDSKGIVALWRESLLAKHVLEGKTRGYTNHPQLYRFKQSTAPLHAINAYLAIVIAEAESRTYRFDREKIMWDFNPVKIPVTSGQIEYEWEHLMRKLFERDKARYQSLKDIQKIEIAGIFRKYNGGIADWEIR